LGIGFLGGMKEFEQNVFEGLDLLPSPNLNKFLFFLEVPQRCSILKTFIKPNIYEIILKEVQGIIINMKLSELCSVLT